MINRLHSFLNPFKYFLVHKGGLIFFTSLFYSLCLVISYLHSLDYTLLSFPGRMIGITTIEAYDVGARVSSFYKAVFLFFISFLTFNAVGYFIFRKKGKLLSATEVRVINYTSIVGLFLFLFQTFDIKIDGTLELIYFIHKYMLFAVLANLLFKKNTISIYYYTLVLCLSFSIYFFILDCFVLSKSAETPDFYIYTFIIASILLASTHLFLIKKDEVIGLKKLRQLAYILVPLVFLPLVSVLKDEVALILKANQIILKSRLPVFISLICFLTLFMFLRYIKSRRGTSVTEKNLVSVSYFPWLSFSLISFIFYRTYADYSEELFEMGNVYLPIMEYMKFGVLAPLEKINAHLLSDYFFAAIYTFFNGLKNGEVTIYDFFLLPVSYLLYYYLMYFLTRNPFVALFSILLFPFAGTSMPDGYSLCILGVFALDKVLIRQASIKNYFYFFLLFILLCLWRFDMTSAFFVLMPLMFLYYGLVDSNFRIKSNLFLKALVFVFLPVFVLLLLIALFRQINILDRIMFMLNYCMSSQSYGYTELGPGDTISYKMHYFIFPAAISILIIVLTLRFKSLNTSKSQRLAYLSLIFICFFYFINFNRGLVRHGLIEGTDAFTSCFVYLIIGGVPFVLFKKQAQTLKFCLFCALTFFATISFKVPDSKNAKSMFELIQIKLKALNRADPLLMTSRLKNIPPDSGDVYRPFVEFIKKTR